MNEQKPSDDMMDTLEKIDTIGSSLESEIDSRSERTIPVTDRDSIERDESFSDELDPGATSSDADDSPDGSLQSARITELEERLVRSLADYDNLRKRSARQLEELSKQANDGLILELLDVLDNVERAESALPTTPDQVGIESIRKGIALIHQQLSNILTRRQIEEFRSVDQPFDAKLHEALMQVPDATRPAGIIALEISRGYKQGERIIRHAKVGVSSGPSRG